MSGESPPEVAEAALTAAGLMVAAGRGRRSALERLSHVRSWWDRDGLIPVVAGSAAIDLYGDSGEFEAALAVHDEVVALVSRLWQDETFGARVRLSALALGQIATQASRSTAAQRPNLARRGEALQEAAAETMGMQRRRNFATGPEGAAWAARVDAEHIRLAWLTGVGSPSEEELIGVWTRAVSAFEELGHVFETARSKARLAAVLRSLGRPAMARPLVDEARATARRLRAEPLLGELRTLGSAASGRPSRAATRDKDLTPREREILRLVVEGRTNADIARQLFISAKTVSVHVSNILAKLGAAGRTEAAALARRQGLLDD